MYMYRFRDADILLTKYIRFFTDMHIMAAILTYNQNQQSMEDDDTETHALLPAQQRQTEPEELRESLEAVPQYQIINDPANFIEQRYTKDGSYLAAFRYQNGTIVKAQNLKEHYSYFFKIDERLEKEDRRKYGFMKKINDMFLSDIIYESHSPDTIFINLNKQKKTYICYFQKKENIDQKRDQLLTDEKKAILAQKIIEYILELNDDFYENQKHSIGHWIIQRLQQEYGQIFKEEVGFFANFFGQGVQYQKRVFKQQRFYGSQSPGKKAAFFPTLTTAQIIRWVFKKTTNANSYVLYGASGIGKSWSFNLISTLFKFHEVIISSSRLKKIHNFVDVNVFKACPKIFYHSITRDSSPQIFYKEVQLQIPFQLSQRTQQDINQAKSADYKAWERVMEAINEQYSEFGVRVVWVLDQINYYYALLREKRKNGQLSSSVDNIEDIFKISLAKTLGCKIYSSSLNIESITLLYGKINGKPQIDILSFRNIKELQWGKNTITTLYETLNFIQFEIVRLQQKYSLGLTIKQLIQKIQSKRLQFEKILSCHQLYNKVKTAFIPITLLNIRLCLSQQSHFQQTIIGEVKQQHTFDGQIPQKVISYLRELKQQSLKLTSRLLYRFIFIQNPTPRESSKRLRKLFQILEIAQQSIKEYPQMQHSTKMLQFKLNSGEEEEEFSSKMVASNKRSIRQLQDELHKQARQRKGKEKYDQLQNLDKNLFYFNPQKKLITTNLSPFDLRMVIRNVLLDNIGRNKSDNKAQRSILDQFFKQGLDKERAICGLLLDKFFAKLFAKREFTLKFFNGETPKLYHIKNKQNSEMYFKHFLAQSNKKVKQKASSAIIAQNVHEVGEIGSSTVKKAKKTKDTCNNKVVRYDQSTYNVKAAKEMLQYHFGKLLKNNDAALKNLKADEYIGAAPIFGQQTTKTSNNSPSIDSIMLQYCRNSNMYIMKTIDFTVSDENVYSLCSRAQKAIYYVDLIEDIAKKSQIKLSCNHIIFASNSILTKFEKMKSGQAAHSQCFDYQKIQVLSMQEMQFIAEKSSYSIFFEKILDITKGDMGKF